MDGRGSENDDGTATIEDRVVCTGLWFRRTRNGGLDYGFDPKLFNGPDDLVSLGNVFRMLALKSKGDVIDIEITYPGRD
jgi:hypothetical protein